MEEPESTGSEHSEPANGIANLVERAFHYRGDVTVWREEGGPVTGYLFNRNARAGEPFVQLFETRTGQDIRIPYKSITQLQFTGRDAASTSVRHFENFQLRQEDPAPDGPAKDSRGGHGHGD